MPRRGHVTKRGVLVDPTYNSKLVTRLVNKVMIDGKRGVARKILYNAFDIIEIKTNEKPVEIFKKALENIVPLLELKVRRVGDTNCQVPAEVSAERRLTLGLRWVINYAHLRSEKTMERGLTAEVVGTANGSGASVKECKDTHKVVEANKILAHYRW